MDILYYSAKGFFEIVKNLFFKDVNIIGLENIPQDGPVIICANHANQFLDAVLLLSSIQRKIGFIVAAKSYRKNVIGHFSKAIHAIPVERPQDIAKAGVGNIREITETLVIGSGTKFTEQVKPGDTLKIKDIPVDVIVKQVNSDTELTYVAEIDVTFAGKESGFKILPKLDQSFMYDAVWGRLKEGGCVGIFPEGGSHDRTQMLPLKAGVCIMALGAMTKNCAPVKIVPCGFNYFEGHKFRSKAIVEFGTPYEVPQKMVTTYLTSKKEAISQLLTHIEKRMNSVKINAPSYTELSSIYLARKLYIPPHTQISPHEEHLLNQILSLGYNQLKDEPEVKDLFGSIRDYYQELKNLKLDDSSFKRISSKDWKNVWNFIFSFFMLFLSGVFALPGLLHIGPLALLIRLLSERERRKALAASSVKVKGVDVIASHKVLCAIVAFPIASFIWTLAFRYELKYLFDITGSLQNILTLIFFITWPFYSYAMILCADGAVRHFKNLKARFILLISPSKILNLKETRNNLQKRITNFVENNARYVINQATVSGNTSEDDGEDRPELPRENSLVPDEALEQAFTILEEIGI